MDNNTILQKPVTVEASELHDSILKLINNSTLHPLLLEVITRDIHNEIVDYVNKLSKQEAKQYQEMINMANQVELDELNKLPENKNETK